VLNRPVPAYRDLGGGITPGDPVGPLERRTEPHKGMPALARPCQTSPLAGSPSPARLAPLSGWLGGWGWPPDSVEQNPSILLTLRVYC